MSITQGIDTALNGTQNVCQVYQYTGVQEAEWSNFIWYDIINHTPTISTASSIENYADWGTFYDYLAVKYTCLFTPLITGDWQWGFFQEDDIVIMRINEDNKYGKSLLTVYNVSGAYSPLWMIAGRTYYLDIRWYELVGSGSVRPRFRIPGDSTLRIIQTTTDICKISLENGFIDNTPLLSVVL